MVTALKGTHCYFYLKKSPEDVENEQKPSDAAEQMSLIFMIIEIHLSLFLHTNTFKIGLHT